MRIERRPASRTGRDSSSAAYARRRFPGDTPSHRWTVEQLESRTLLSGGPPPAVPVPAAHWAFDEGSGPTAGDSSGNGHTGTLGSGVSWVTGNVGTHAVGLNGSAGAVVTVAGPVVNTAGSFTASAWVDLASVSGYQTVLSIAGTNVAGFFLQLRSDTGTFAFTRLAADSTTAATTYVASPTLPTTGMWYHLVGVDDATAGTLTLYVDGQSMGSTPYTGGWAATGATLIGHGFYSGSQVDYVNGSIDDAQMFSSALSAAQVVALDQPAAYAFDEGTGTTSADVSGHGNTITLNAGASWAPGRIGSNSLAVNGTATGNATLATPVINTALPFSVSAWVNLSSLSGYQTFVSIDGVNTSGFYLQLTGDTQKFSFSRLGSDSTNAPSYRAQSTATPSTGVWYNLVGVNNVATGQIQLYVNGVLQSTANYRGGWQATGATVIGGAKFGGSRTDFVSGDIDDVRFYNSPLSAADAANIGTAGSSTITVATGTTGVTVSPDLFGAFLEDINYGGEGGIYNDEARNSGFNDSTNPLNAWGAVAGNGVNDSLASDTTTGPTAALNQSAALHVTSGVSASARAGISNSGYFGVAVAPSTSYQVDFFAKATAGFTGPLTVDLESTTGTVYATATVSSVTSSWADYTTTLTTGVNTPTTATNLFVISTNSPSANGATIWFGATYLYPPSYDGASNHLRIDLMQELAALKPAIFRVPGGNYLEGNTYATHFEWSNTIGPVDDRPGHYDSAWGYWSTDGMGLDEYLQMAEEVGAQPILAVYAGYTLNGSSDTGTTLANDVTDAINEIHYVLDPVTTAWGAERAANGHPAPYDVNDVEVGNEDFFSSTYSTRYPLFYNAIHTAFPQLKIIATSTSTGGSPYGVVDDHFYETPQWFEANSNYFDNTARNGSSIFIGEYASNQGSPTPDLESALGDSSWLLGLERNSDLVTMSSYAPLLVNVSSYQWPTNLIGFNNTTSYGSPSYWAQVILSQNHGTTVVSDTVSGATGLQTLVTRTGTTYYVTVINTLGTANPATVNLTGVSTVSAAGTAVTLTASSNTAVNSIANPTAVVPVTSAVTGLGTTFGYTFPGYSITVLQLTADSAPTVATAAAASPSPVTGTTANLSVLGTDAAGESSLTYTWSATGPAAVTFSVNGTNTAKNTVATFTTPGSYTVTATITNAFGLSVTSAVVVPVSQTLTLTSPTLNNAIVTGATTQVSATDQFGNAISPVTWSVAGGGTISSTGLFTAGSAGGTSVVTGTGDGQTATLTITVVPVTYTGPAGGDTYAIRIDPANPLLEDIFVNTPETSAPTCSIARSLLPSLTFAPAGGDGSLTVDFADGNPLPGNGVTYTGGPNPTATGNTLRIAGVAAGAMVFSINGSQVINSAAASSPISYAALRSVEFDLLGGSNLLTQTAQPSAAVTYNAGAGANTLNVSGGMFTLSADPQLGSGSLTVNDNAAVVFAAPAAGSGINVRHLAALNIAAGATAALATAAAASDRTLLVAGTLSVGSTGRLDLGGNDADITAGSLATVTSQIALGYNHGSWLGNGITSSAAAGDTSHLTAVGVLVNNNAGIPLYGSGAPLGLFDGTNPSPADILLRYTGYGDSNLDGHVDGSDYSRLDNGYLHGLTGWANGDFNCDNVVDGSDYTLIDNDFNNRPAQPAASVSPEIATAAATVVSPDQTAPATRAAPTRFAPQIFSSASERAAIAGTPLQGDLTFSATNHRDAFFSGVPQGRVAWFDIGSSSLRAAAKRGRASADDGLDDWTRPGRSPLQE